MKYIYDIILNFNERFSSSLNNSNNNLISIKHVDSFKYKGIQIADLISWSVFQSLEHMMMNLLT